MAMGRILFSLLFLILLSLVHNSAVALPLSTDGRWIVDEMGQRVKLACVNWVSHLDAVVAEGLSKQPVDEISRRILGMGFNCVRLTWPLYLATNESLASLSVRRSFQGLGLFESIAGFQSNNPSLIDLTLIDAYKAVVSSLAKNGVMVILDNHLSKPGWCCNNYDDNGFFGDKYFNPDLWLKGLTKMATMFNDTANVVGMSLRNELRGPRQNVNDWYKYMQRGAEAVHSVNPNILVILSGLNYDRDFSFLARRAVNLTFTGKLVFEVHWYGFSDGDAWRTGKPNQVCARALSYMNKKSGFVLDQGYPLFVSEFGVDLRGTNVNDNRYLSCFLGWAAELDLDWALWTLVGSYYLREGVIGLEEFYGVFDWNWCGPRNSSFFQRISILQSPLQGPGVSETQQHQILYHPLTGLCVQRRSIMDQFRLGACSEAATAHWSYSSTRNTLTLKGTYFCLQADGVGQPAKLGLICTDNTSKWEPISDSKMHLSSRLTNGSTVCLDADPTNNNIVITSYCRCLYGDNMCDPESQWFKIVNSSRSGTGGTSSILNTALTFLEKSLLGSL